MEDLQNKYCKQWLFVGFVLLDLSPDINAIKKNKDVDVGKE
jgi:hypothetical protein